MTAAELRYMIALHALQKEGACVRGSDLASKMGVSKVSAYRMCERLKSHALLLGSGEGSLALTARGEELLAEYEPCIAFVREKLEERCRTPKNIAAREAVDLICAVGEGSRAALVGYLRGRADHKQTNTDHKQTSTDGGSASIDCGRGQAPSNHR